MGAGVLDAAARAGSRHGDAGSDLLWRAGQLSSARGQHGGSLGDERVEVVAEQRVEQCPLQDVLEVVGQVARVTATVEPSFFTSNAFSVRSVASKALILLLASMQSASLFSRERIHLEEVLAEPDRREYHHCFPGAFLKQQGPSDGEVNAPANFVLSGSSGSAFPGPVITSATLPRSSSGGRRCRS